MRILDLKAVAIASMVLVAGTGPSWAASIICQSINGRMQCFEGQGSLSCTTVNGRTVCERSGDLTPIDPPMLDGAQPGDEANGEADGLTLDDGLSIDIDESGIRIRMGTAQVAPR